MDFYKPNRFKLKKNYQLQQRQPSRDSNDLRNGFPSRDNNDIRNAFPSRDSNDIRNAFSSKNRYGFSKQTI